MEHSLKTLAHRKNLAMKYYVILAAVVGIILAGVGLFFIIYNAVLKTDSAFSNILLGVLLLLAAILYSAIVIVRGLTEKNTPTEAVVYEENSDLLVLVSKSGRQTALKPENLASVEPVDNESALARFYGDTKALLIKTKDGGEFSLPYIENYEEAVTNLKGFIH